MSATNTPLSPTALTAVCEGYRCLPHPPTGGWPSLGWQQGGQWVGGRVTTAPVNPGRHQPPITVILKRQLSEASPRFGSPTLYFSTTFCHQNGWHVTKDSSIEFREAYMSLGGRSGLWPLDQGCRQVSLETLGDQTHLGNFGTCPDYPSCMRTIAILTDHFFAFWKMLSYPLRVYGCVSPWTFIKHMGWVG